MHHNEPKTEILQLQEADPPKLTAAANFTHVRDALAHLFAARIRSKPQDAVICVNPTDASIDEILWKQSFIDGYTFRLVPLNQPSVPSNGSFELVLYGLDSIWLSYRILSNTTHVIQNTTRHRQFSKRSVISAPTDPSLTVLKNYLLYFLPVKPCGSQMDLFSTPVAARTPLGQFNSPRQGTFHLI